MVTAPKAQQFRQGHDGLLFLHIPNLHAPEQYGVHSFSRQPFIDDNNDFVHLTHLSLTISNEVIAARRESKNSRP